MSEPGEPNPYAPPAGPLLVVQPSQPRMKRPASVKGVIGFGLFFVTAIAVGNGYAANLVGWQKLIQSYLADPLGLFLILAKLVGALGVILAGRSVAGYWLGCLFLGIYVLTAPFNLRMSVEVPAGSGDFVASSGSFALVAAIVLFVTILAIRFAFGKPSRAYYRRGSNFLPPGANPSSSARASSP